MSMNSVTEEIIRGTFRGEEPLEIPVITFRGESDGPEFTVMSGMHAGEYSGILAAQRLINHLRTTGISGTVRVIPVVSTRAFMARNMQLSPVDQREVHFYGPGNADNSYTEFQIDTLYKLLVTSNYVIDMHSGEFAQALHSWIPVPMQGSDDFQRRTLSLALGYPVEHIELRRERESVPALVNHLADDGVANIWAEIGKNGLPNESHIDAHYQGLIAALQTAGNLAGEPQRPSHTFIEGSRRQINADVSGVWHPAVKEGDIVEPGQPLGNITDYFGTVLEEYFAEERALVLYYWTSPAIDHLRRPHGYDWHSGLVSLLTIDEASDTARLDA
ncbi:MAG: succinylglutamate desuccinylase/aspartoacylase family protein [Chloroflexi bacterium]|nr:succinylglutamate desuccinylase/aspartoacylase family protein [Chloroflexota bacterium]